MAHYHEHDYDENLLKEIIRRLDHIERQLEVHPTPTSVTFKQEEKNHES